MSKTTKKNVSTESKKSTKSTKSVKTPKSQKSVTSTRSEKTIEEKYQKKTPHEHILHSPDTYIGSIEDKTCQMWVFNDSSDDDTGAKIVFKEITYVPGFYKCCDEVYVNAIDHTVRCKTCNIVKINVDKETGRITVWNNGDGIDVVEHQEHKIMVPSLIFGEVLTSTNYDKSEVKIIGGKNGYGAKLANIYSKEFEIETIDATRNLKFYQKFENNMYTKNKHKVTSGGGKKPYTKISFIPDFEKFGLKGITDDMFALLKKRAYDLAMKGLAKIYFNDKLITQNTFQKYVELYFPEGSEHKKVFDVTTSDRWKVCAVYDTKDELEHQNISFVNSICTNRGGTHVDQVVSQVVDKLKIAVSKKVKGAVIKPAMIKENLLFFVDAIIENPDFDTQTKECLTTKTIKFGSKFTVTDAFMKKVISTGVVNQIITNVNAIADAKLSKDGKGRGVVRYDKLYNAHYATPKDGWQCKLILTEGDSAKTFAMSGLNVVGRDYYGVFPLKGKLLNVRDENPIKVSNNEEITALKKIIGLEHKKVYDDLKGLRYGGIIILTDQDSVTADTPLLLKNNNDNIEIKTIDDLSDNWIMNPNGKEYSTTDYQIWTENGWTGIKKIIRHKVSKPIYRVLTHTGVVDVTEDHSLLDMNGKKISPKKCAIDDQLLHSYPRFEDNSVDIPEDLESVNIYKLRDYASELKIQYYQRKTKSELIDCIREVVSVEHLQLNMNVNIEVDEAYVMGFFWADGTAGIYEWKHLYKNKDRPRAYISNRTSYNWSLSNTNLTFLENCKKILEKHYDYEFKIVECDVSKLKNRQRYFKLIINGGQKTIPIVQKYRNLFYDKDRHKRVPPEILNAPYEVRKSFFKGYYDGDGCKYHLETTGSKYFEICGKIGAHGMYFLCKSIGYEVSINHNIKKPRVYCLTITKGSQQHHPDTIKKIFCLGETEQYVYDLETENHHFQAGIGRLIVHNTDGSHIKGLIMNFIHSFWPSLAKYEGFIQCLATPVLKITKGSGKKNVKTESFYSLSEFEKWKAENNNGKGWNKPKYYKGLATSKPEEAQECFTDLEEKLISYIWPVDNGKSGKSVSKSKSDEKDKSKKSEFIDEESDMVSDNYKPKSTDICEDAITLAFDKKRADDRKLWLNTFDPNAYIDNTEKRITFSDFIHREFIAFSMEDNVRSIPNIMDGYKPSQRKVYYGSILENIYKKEIRVAQLSASISKNTVYHHGEASLNSTIIGMAQNFVGSNNINLLMPNGGFGSRLQGGKDAGSERYLNTQLDELGKKIFIEEDFDILQHQMEEGLKIEPVFYVPILPMILVNGSIGIGTGYSTTIQPCNPRDIWNNLKRILDGQKPFAMKPWFRHFTGIIEKINPNEFVSRAKYEIINDDTIHITDLPIGIWTENYRAFLNNLLDGGNGKPIKKGKDEPTTTAKATRATKAANSRKARNAKNAKKSRTAKVAKSNTIGSCIKTYIDNCTDIRIDIQIIFHPGKLNSLIKSGKLEKGLKLVTSLSNKNMHLFNEHGKIKKYDSYGAILKNYSIVRLELYQTRKDFLLGKWRHEMDILQWKMKFLEFVIQGKIIIFENKKPRKKTEVMATIEKLGFPKFITTGDKPSYEYITNTGLFHLTEEDLENLRKQLENKQEQIETLESKSPSQLWTEELDEFMNAYDIWEAECDAAYDSQMSKKAGSTTSRRRRATKKKPENNIEI